MGFYATEQEIKHRMKQIVSEEKKECYILLSVLL